MSLINDFLEGRISGKSLSAEQARELIMYDVKQDLIGDGKAQAFIHEKKNELLQAKNLSIEDTELKEFFQTHEDELSQIYYREDDTSRGWLKNWLSYQALIALGMKINCNTAEKAKKIIKKIYEVELYGESGRHYNKEKYIFESDTVHSLGTVFCLYMQKLLAKEGKRLETEYTKEFDVYAIIDFYKYLYLLVKIDEILATADEKTVKELELLSRLTHSVFNFGLVPYHFSAYRKRPSNYCSFWDLSFADCMTKDKRKELAEKIMSGKTDDIVLMSLEGYQNVLNTMPDATENYNYYRSDTERMKEFRKSVENICQAVRSIRETWIQKTNRKEKLGKISEILEDLDEGAIYTVLANMNTCVTERGTIEVRNKEK